MNFLFFTLILVLCVFPKAICGRTNGGMFSLGMANAAIAVGAPSSLTSVFVVREIHYLIINTEP